MDTAAVIAAVPVGLLVGGLVTMLVDRVPDATPLAWRSRCPACEAPLAVGETVPVLSWIRLGGSCAYCDDRITPTYPVVEIVTALLWVAVVARFGWEWVVLPPLVMVTALLALSVIDLHVYRLPDRLTFPALLSSFVVMIPATIALERPGALTKAVGGMLIYFVILLVAHLISPRGMGFGDVKLSLLLGLHLGWAAGSVYVGWATVFRFVFYALLTASLFGVIGGVVVALLRRFLARDLLTDPEADGGQPTRLLGQSFPFGPALAAGTVVVVMFADTFAAG